jgi:hypothetical protein
MPRTETLVLGLAQLHLEQTDCCTCGVLFAMPTVLLQQRRQDGQHFYCPNGHPQVFRLSDADRLRAELDAERKRHENTERLLRQAEKSAEWARDERDRTRRSLSATRGELTKVKNRVRAGVCPCCNRTFQALARHMKSQHPEWKAEADA